MIGADDFVLARGSSAIAGNAVVLRGSSMTVVNGGERIVLYGDLTKREQEVLYRYCQTPGLHVDIGTMFGGSAHTAAIAKNGNGHVYSLDPDPKGADSALNSFMGDWRQYITLVEEHSQTWTPPEAPATVFIDGDHEVKGCLTDWIRYSAITTKYILFHDTDLEGVKLVIAGANRDPRWKLVERVDKIAVYERVDDANE